MLIVGSECGVGRSISDHLDLSMLTAALTGQKLTGAETNKPGWTKGPTLVHNTQCDDEE